MKLSEIQAIIGGERLGPAGDPELEEVWDNSSRVTPGSLFVALRGTVTDGHRFIADALDRGAAALLVEEVAADCALSLLRAPALRVPDTARAARRLAAPFFGHPSRRLGLIGVTGTNGKTTTTYMLEAILAAAGHRPGVIGTIEYRYGGQRLPAPNTSPDALPLQALLAQMQAGGVDRVVMEVSSHAIKLGRIEGMAFDAVLFTNLTVEHTDFHPDMEDYYRTKACLFEADPIKQRIGVINIDDPWGRRLAGEAVIPCTTLSLGEEEADLVATAICPEKGGVRFVASGPDFPPLPLFIHLAGRFNAMNALGAVAVAWRLGVDRPSIVRGLDALSAVPGRFENVGRAGDVPVIVDYAHTPDGLENLLQAARAECRGQLITVFGCGGDRSREKRPVMGRVVGRYADWVVLTSDNPRTEDPGRIIEDVLPGLRETCQSYEVEPDRRRAIARAIARATGPEDMVVIAGKGHEDYQIIGRTKHHFDDREVAREVLEGKQRATDTVIA